MPVVDSRLVEALPLLNHNHEKGEYMMDDVTVTILELWEGDLKKAFTTRTDRYVLHEHLVKTKIQPLFVNYTP